MEPASAGPFQMDNDTTTTTMAPPPAPLNPTRDALKAVLMIVLFILTFLASLVPFALRNALTRAHRQSLNTIFSLLSCLGAGVFLGTCLLDLLPDSVECVEKAMKSMELDVDFPITEFAVVCGFLLVLFIEQIIEHAKEKGWIEDSGFNRILDHHHEQPEDVMTSSHHSQHHEAHFNEESNSTIRAVLLVVALSVHAAFEGLSLGTISDVSSLFQVFAALCIHKILIGFTLGMRMVQSNLHTFTMVLCCAAFAGQVLVGGFGGLLLIDFLTTKSAGLAHLISGLLQGVACGTFFYITSFEILPHELNAVGNRPLKMLFLTAGFLLISGFIAFLPDPDK
uniref:Zinc transporter ZIP3 n=1 Tax=Steinernema glaseri TaxID=37863 RepID=A0A1I8AMH3_9BILA